MPEPRTTLAKALHSPEFLEILPRLVTYAARRLRRLGWAEGTDHVPSAAEAGDVVNDAVAACLAGTWVWPDDMDLETFLTGVMWSQLGHARRKHKRTRTRPIEDAAALSASAAPSDEQLAQRRLLASVERTLAGDAEIGALLGAMGEGHTKRAALAEALGWTPDRVKTVRIRMNRRLAAAGMMKEEEAP